MPFSEMMCPANSISVPILNFFREIMILFSLHLSNKTRVWLINSSSVPAKIIMSSTGFLTHVNPSTMISDLQHPLAEDAFRPIGAWRYLNFTCGRRNVVISKLLGASASWKYPCTVSNFAKYFTVLGIACSILFVHGNGCTGRFKN